MDKNYIDLPESVDSNSGENSGYWFGGERRQKWSATVEFGGGLGLASTKPATLIPLCLPHNHSPLPLSFALNTDASTHTRRSPPLPFLTLATAEPSHHISTDSTIDHHRRHSQLTTLFIMEIDDSIGPSPQMAMDVISATSIPSSFLNPHAPMFVPLAYRTVEDFSDDGGGFLRRW
ncbi:hypothetical protein ACFE04_011193 [Oxalis oulophora]